MGPQEWLRRVNVVNKIDDPGYDLRGSRSHLWHEDGSCTNTIEIIVSSN
jgi:hypothetical protein